MKKALSFAVALGLVAGMASSAVAADLVLKGDARLRGQYKNNTTDANSTIGDRIQKFDQRYRLDADVMVNDDVKINTRLVLADNEFGNENSLNHYVDRANMVIKTMGGTVTLGRQNASWGNKFLGWGSSVDRIKYVAKAGDVTWGGYLQKSKEGDNGIDGDGDTDTFGGLVIANAGGAKVGVLANYIYKDDKVFDNASTTGYLLDVFVNGKAGPANIMAELVYKGGDAAGNGNVNAVTGLAEPDAYYGGFVGASMNLNDQLTMKALVAFYDGNMGDTSASRDCDNDFAPSLMIGTCNETAIIDFGGTTKSTDDMTYLVVVGGDMKVSDKVTLGAGVGFLSLTDEGTGTVDPITGVGTANETLTEVDLSMKYAITQNTTYSLGLGYGMFDSGDATWPDDDMIVIGNRVDVKF